MKPSFSTSVWPVTRFTSPIKWQTSTSVAARLHCHYMSVLLSTILLPSAFTSTTFAKRLISLSRLSRTIIGARLDYCKFCNSLLYGISKQPPHITARKTLSRAWFKASTVSNSLHQFWHWLPISTRIEFKRTLLTFMTLKTNQPS